MMNFLIGVIFIALLYIIGGSVIAAFLSVIINLTENNH